MRQLKVSRNYYTERSDNVARYFSDVKHANKNVSFYEDESNLTKEQLILHNLKFAITIAKKYVGHGIELEDLIQAANSGLIKAAEKYDPTTGLRFISYAVWWIRNSILDLISLNKIGIKSNVALHKDCIAYYQNLDQLNQEYGKLLTIEEVEAINPDLVSPLFKKHFEARRIHHFEDSMNKNSTDENDDDFYSIYGDGSELEQTMDMDSLRANLKQIMDQQLTKREKYVIISHFYKEQSFSEIAFELRVTRECIRLNYCRAIKKLQKYKKYLLK